MIRMFDGETFEAFTRLLAQPDPTDLPRRAHVLRCPGDPDRRVTRLPPIFMAWLQWRCLTVDGEESVLPASRGVEPTLVLARAIRPRLHAEWRGGRGLAPSPALSAAPSAALSMCPSSLEALA